MRVCLHIANTRLSGARQHTIIACSPGVDVHPCFIFPHPSPLTLGLSVFLALGLDDWFSVLGYRFLEENNKNRAARTEHRTSSHSHIQMKMVLTNPTIL